MAARRPPSDLPGDLELPLTSGEPWWYWTGGRPALDLVNTLRERWWRRVECLCTPADLQRWLAESGLLAPTTSATEEQLEDARTLREAIDDLIVAQTRGTAPPATSIGTVNRHLGQHRPPYLEVDGDHARLTQTPPVESVTLALTLIARDAAEMFGTDDRHRVRVCQAQDCSARFYDRSPAGRRRWCTMNRCGNRNNVRAHRRRRSTPGDHHGVHPAHS